MSKDSGTVNIHGKSYQTVALRVHTFRETHPNWALVTEVVSRDEDCVVMRASISDETGRLLATGHAEEYRASSQINRTSALENAETSAIGRALAALGFGGTEFATANEVQNAIHQQSRSVTAGAWEAISEEGQEYLLGLAGDVRGCLEAGDPAAAWETIETAQLSPEEKVALWTRLDSKERTAIKAAQKAKELAALNAAQKAAVA